MASNIFGSILFAFHFGSFLHGLNPHDAANLLYYKEDPAVAQAVTAAMKMTTGKKHKTAIREKVQGMASKKKK